MTQINIYQLSEKKNSGNDRIFKEVKIILDFGH
jgi:hypothetical protein